MKVLIVSPCVNLPVPAVKGGAVSTLIESIIEENERQSRMELTVVGVFDEDAVKKAEIYPRTEFVFLKHNKVDDGLDSVIDRVMEKLNRKPAMPHQYIWKMHVVRHLKKLLIERGFDRVIFENSGYLLNVLKNQTIYRKYQGKLYYHLHNDIPDNVYVTGVKQCKLLLISDYLRKKINILCGPSMDAQSYVIRNGFNCDRFALELSNQECSELRGKLNIGEEQKIVLFTGRINPAKGIAKLTQAISEMESPDVTLLVVGAHNFGTDQTSVFEKEMKKRFKALGSRVCFTGYVPYLDIWKYYKLANVVVLPSMWEEPAGLTMIEACAAGVPLVTTNSGGIPEYVCSEWAILLERDKDIVKSISNAIYDVLNNNAIGKEKTSLAKQYVQTHYNVKVFYNNFVETLSEERE